MISNTEALKRLKIEQQRILDFTVLICHAVPNVKKTISGYEESIPFFSLPKPDYFNHESEDRIKKLAKHYKENLSKYLLLSSFSFFESYVKSAIEELIEFHGGQEAFVENLLNRQRDKTNSYNTEEKKSIRKLQEPIKPKNWQRYKKHQDILNDSSNFRNPSELFSALGLKRLFELISNGNFRSVTIPEIMEMGFNLDLSEKVNKHTHLINKDLKDTFHYMRELRNSIGHGDSPQLSFDKTMDLVRFLRYLAVKFDRHLVEKFFILERYN